MTETIHAVPEMSTNDLFTGIREIIRSEIKTVVKGDLAEKLLSQNEAAQFLGITTMTLWKWENDGRIKFHRIGKKKFYKYSELLASLETCKKYGRVHNG